MLPTRLASLLARHGQTGRTARPRRRRRRECRLPAGRLLADRGDVGELRARADAGDLRAASRLAELLAGQGEMDEAMQILHALAAAGEGDDFRLADLLMRQGRREEAQRLRWFGLKPDGSVAEATERRH